MMNRGLVYTLCGAVMAGCIAFASSLSVFAAPVIETGDENYIRVGGEAWICHYAPTPEPEYRCDMLPDGTWGPEYICGYSKPSDAAEGFVRADYSSNATYQAFRDDVLNGIAINSQKGKTRNIMYYGKHIYQPKSEEEYAEYKNIANNVLVDLIKEGIIKNGYVSVCDKKSYDTGAIWINATHFDTQIICWMVNGEIDEPEIFFGKYPNLKPYYKQ